MNMSLSKLCATLKNEVVSAIVFPEIFFLFQIVTIKYPMEYSIAEI